MVKEAIVKSSFAVSLKVIFDCLLNAKFEQQHHALEGNIGVFFSFSFVVVSLF
jgi:hypothetical protein